MMSLIIILLVIVAAISNAIMDIIKHHWEDSVFAPIRVLDKYRKLYHFFHKDGWKWKYIDWDNGEHGRVKWRIVIPYWYSKSENQTSALEIKFNKPVQFTDAWHFFKSLMIICLIAAIVLGIYYIPNYEIKWWRLLSTIVGIGTIWNLTFLVFYKAILIRRG